MLLPGLPYPAGICCTCPWAELPCVIKLLTQWNEEQLALPSRPRGIEFLLTLPSAPVPPACLQPLPGNRKPPLGICCSLRSHPQGPDSNMLEI